MGVVEFNKNKYVCNCVEFYGDIMLLDGWCKPLFHRGQNYVLDVSEATFKSKIFGDLGESDNGIGFKKVKLTGDFEHITVRVGGVLMKYVIDTGVQVVLAS